MQLSDAMATGRVLVPKLKAADLSACALGMAGYAVGLDMVYGKYVEIEAKWPWLKTQGQPCVCGESQGMNTRLFDIIHRFDYHVMLKGDWTLDQLIDWVRSVEPQETPAEAPAESAPLVREKVL